MATTALGERCGDERTWRHRGSRRLTAARRLAPRRGLLARSEECDADDPTAGCRSRRRAALRRGGGERLAGYAVFAIDRLGYGESPYERPPGSGFLLTPDAYIEMTHQMVTQIRTGSFTDCAGNATGHRAARVVLSGFSSGAAIVEGYATRYHDIDGIIPMSWSNQPELSTAFRMLIDVLAPQLAAGKDYLEFFTDGADGYSEFCEQFLFYAPGMSDDALEQLCGPDYYAQTAFPTPSGENTPALQASTIATIGNVGPTPVLLVFSDHAAAFPGADRRGADPDLVTPEIAMWRNGCNCDVSAYLQKNAGHVGLFHKTSKRVTDRILDWLDDHDL